MKPIEWHEYCEQLWDNQKLPKEYKWVLVLKKSKDEYLPNPMVAGYLRFGAGDKHSPYFVTPGVPGDSLAWSDTLMVENREVWTSPEDELPEIDYENQKSSVPVKIKKANGEIFTGFFRHLFSGNQRIGIFYEIEGVLHNDLTHWRYYTRDGKDE